MREFSAKGYEGASLNAACAENGISKGIVYHHFKDKNELYLLCVGECFDRLTAYLRERLDASDGPAEERLRSYFDGRLHFFAENPLYLGIFADAAFRPPMELSAEIAECREAFDKLNIAVLTALLDGRRLRKGLSIPAIVEAFRTYMDFFNMQFQTALHQGCAPERVLQEHEERCHQQLDILLHGVLGE
jgi:TetR/AcrR family transcriptional regulator